MSKLPHLQADTRNAKLRFFLALALKFRVNFTRVKRDNASANVRPSCWDAECSNVLAFASDG